MCFFSHSDLYPKALLLKVLLCLAICFVDFILIPIFPHFLIINRGELQLINIRIEILKGGKRHIELNRVCWIFLKVLVAQMCPTLCDPMDCKPPGFSVHGILQARILDWVAFPFPWSLPDPGIEPCLLHCRQILYCPSHRFTKRSIKVNMIWEGLLSIRI